MSVPFVTSPSGVKLFTDYRDNLIVDRYAPVFARMRASKLKHLHSVNSEDAVTHNVFCSLRHIDPAVWMPILSEAALGEKLPARAPVTVELWPSIPPPHALVLTGDEGDSEVDVVIQSPDWVWFIEAKLNSDISTGTTTRPRRDQLLRNIDVGSYFAGVRPFYFSLLFKDEAHTREGARLLDLYKDGSEPRRLLSEHRPDGLVNLRRVSRFTWPAFQAVFDFAAANAPDDERLFAQRAISWMTTRGLAI